MPQSLSQVSTSHTRLPARRDVSTEAYFVVYRPLIEGVLGVLASGESSRIFTVDEKLGIGKKTVFPTLREQFPV